MILIEPQWNVDALDDFLNFVLKSILIEPQWNVDDDYSDDTIEDFIILIEPQWNVDGTMAFDITLKIENFNRTIVECRQRKSKCFNNFK